MSQEFPVSVLSGGSRGRYKSIAAHSVTVECHMNVTRVSLERLVSFQRASHKYTLESKDKCLVPFPEIMRRTLELKVKDFDKFSRHCVIGRVQIPLESANLGRPCRTWRPLAPYTSVSDPYVRVSIVLRGRHHKSKKTTVKRNTLEPTYHESFSFRLTSADLRETSIVVTVWDFNAGVVRDEFIGRIVIGKEGSGISSITVGSLKNLTPRKFGNIFTI
ncbi:Synaptotagmin-1 [Armadillidium vulgare]|nr:Synaptotagmin-1 [Armadillidium vulgare]